MEGGLGRKELLIFSPSQGIIKHYENLMDKGLRSKKVR